MLLSRDRHGAAFCNLSFVIYSPETTPARDLVGDRELRSASFMPSCKVLLALAAVIGTLVGPARGQTFYGSVVGIVTDASGSPVPDTAVTVTNTGTSERHP